MSEQKSATTDPELVLILERCRKDQLFTNFVERENISAELLASIVAVFFGLGEVAKQQAEDEKAMEKLYDRPLENIKQEYPWLTQRIQSVLVWQVLMAHVRGKDPAYNVGEKYRTRWSSSK